MKSTTIVINMSRSIQQITKQQLIWCFQIIPIKMYQQLIVIGLITKWSIQ